MGPDDDIEPVGRAPRPQVRLMAVGAVIGAVALGASLTVQFTGGADPEMPQLPGLPSPGSGFPSVLPTGESGLTGGTGPTSPGEPTSLPTELPSLSLPSGFPSDFPTDLELPSLPAVPGDVS